MNKVYLKKKSTKVVPRISTEKFRRRFGVDSNKLHTKRVNLDSEHFKVPIVCIKRNSSFYELKNKLEMTDEVLLSQSPKNYLNNISLITEEDKIMMKECISEEDSSLQLINSFKYSNIDSKSVNSSYSSISSEEEGNSIKIVENNKENNTKVKLKIKIQNKLPPKPNKEDFKNLIKN